MFYLSKTMVLDPPERAIFGTELVLAEGQMRAPEGRNWSPNEGGIMGENYINLG